LVGGSGCGEGGTRTACASADTSAIVGPAGGSILSSLLSVGASSGGQVWNEIGKIQSKRGF
jgi:hypothetical protein